MKKLKAFAGDGSCTYPEILIFQIEMAKKLLILNLSQGDQVRIPDQLQQS